MPAGLGTTRRRPPQLVSWILLLREKWRDEPGEAMNVWKIVKNRLPFFGTLPFFWMSAGEMRTSASSGNAEKALYA
jgi:hypothetical protein